MGLASGEGELRSLTGEVIEARPPNILVKSLTLAFLSILRLDVGLSLAAGLGGGFNFDTAGEVLLSLFC